MRALVLLFTKNHSSTGHPRTGLDARGSSNIFRFNTIEYNSGTGIRFGGHTVNNYTYGVDNEAYGNEMFENDYGGVKIMVGAARAPCPLSSPRILFAVQGGRCLIYT